MQGYNYAAIQDHIDPIVCEGINPKNNESEMNVSSSTLNETANHYNQNVDKRIRKEKRLDGLTSRLSTLNKRIDSLYEFLTQINSNLSHPSIIITPEQAKTLFEKEQTLRLITKLEDNQRSIMMKIDEYQRSLEQLPKPHVNPKHTEELIGYLTHCDDIKSQIVEQKGVIETLNQSLGNDINSINDEYQIRLQREKFDMMNLLNELKTQSKQIEVSQIDVQNDHTGE